MNSLFLLLAGVVALAFGYRFYAKLLALGVFRLDPARSLTPPEAAPTELGSERPVLFAQHVAALMPLLTIVGALLAVVWGWVPVFLWVIVGAALAGGIHGMGSLWLRLRDLDTDLAAVAGRYLAPRARLALLLLAGVLLAGLTALLAVIAAQLLAAQPASFVPLAALVGLALALGVFLRVRDDLVVLPAVLIALAVALAVAWLFGHVPVSITGALNLDLLGHSLVTVEATAVWAIALGVFAWQATRLPLTRLARPLALLAVLLLAACLLVVLLAVAIDRPTLALPEFHFPPQAPAVLPWLFATLIGGAIGGVHLLVAHGLTAPQLRRETDCRLFGYGGAIVDALIALSVIVVIGAAFSDVDAFVARFDPSAGIPDLAGQLAFFVEAFGQLAARLGIAAGVARQLMAVTLLLLAVTGLDTLIRLQQQLLDAALRGSRLAAMPEKSRRRLAVAPAVLLAVIALAMTRLADAWPLLGTASLALAATGLMLLLSVLRHHRQPTVWVWLPLVPLAAISLWMLGELIVHGWIAGRLWLSAAALALLALAAIVAAAARPPRPPAT